MHANKVSLFDDFDFPQNALVQMISATWISRSIYVAAKLGIADLLKDGQKNYGEIASLTQTDENALFRLLRALSSLGVFIEKEPGNFALTATANLLRSDVSDSLRAYAIMLGEQDYEAWKFLAHSIKTGESAFKKSYGVEVFEYFKRHPEAAGNFNAAMTSYSSMAIPAIVSSYDFSTTNVLVDIAGGTGSLITSILEAYPSLQGILFELPPVIEKASPVISTTEVSDRCQLVAGNFFESIPQGGDVYLLKHILHNWNDESVLSILRNCRQAMAASSKLLLIEHLILPGNEPCFGKLVDVSMLVWCKGGKERTEVEYANLLDLAGFKLVGVIATQTSLSILEAVPK